MLFTTVPFALLFLPVVLIGFYTIANFSVYGAAAWLFAVSLFFYGYWMPELTLLLAASICGNYLIGTQIAKFRPDPLNGRLSKRSARSWMITGIAANLALLAYFKYANFFIDNLNLVLATHLDIGKVVLPIGISFFTFTQIAFLADSYQKGTREYNFIHYGLFVTYFPHLIAGPVLHHAQMMPQFQQNATYQFNSANFAGGLLIFALGLFKKIVLADGVSPYADAVFKPSDAGMSPDFWEAWLGTMAYTFQLYFDFSGYSDMAIGLSWMFNIRLPFNFDSPYRATSISDFWRRWHISLSNFLRDYLYIAMGGNRFGSTRRYVNLMATMVLGGLWHGAGWPFIIWGFLHGCYLWINHGFRTICGPKIMAQLDQSRAYSLFAWALTMLAVVVAWVLFRSQTLAGAGRVLAGMFNQNPALAGGIHPLLWNAGLQPVVGFGWCCALAAMAFMMPNSNLIGRKALALCQAHGRTKAVIGGVALAMVGFLILLNTARDSVSAFIYFNF